ncbi:MAG: sulfotransferase [Moorea sp. SIO1F2]|uniref:sulfotransferase family protein n=1 Tax=Moorena sp. SIO1F2 TaxID=2607819 RepID=UPI0013B90AB1|nr:sulfotransferase [Moorena sp. SIO1F2]NET82464.1 sulfotransferase [Moorena sp. SIO1F2]
MKETSTETPFFIVGCPRSGTTLLQVLMDAHPDICIPPESHIFPRFSESFDDYGDLSQNYNLKLFVKDILNDEPIKLWGLKISVPAFCSKLQERSVKGVISRLFELYAEREGKSKWGDKTPQHAMYLKQIKALFPQSRIIHIIRDGRDVAESLSRVLIGPKSIYGIAHRWKKYILSFQEFKKTINSHEFLEVHYENLVKNPKKELSKIFKFLGEDYSEDDSEVVQDIPETVRKHHYLKAATLHDSLNKSISSQKIGVFKSKFKTREIEIFESIAGEALTGYGYSLETSGKTHIKRKEMIVFFIEDYLLRYLKKFVRPDMMTLILS